MLKNSLLCSSISVLPYNKSLADEIGIPFIIEYRPFEKDNDDFYQSVIPLKLPKCAHCSAYITKTFSIDKDHKVQCPFCGKDFSFNSSININYQSFKMEKAFKNFGFYICFILDLDCTDNLLKISKQYISIALNALLPETKFIFAYIKQNNLHFLKLINGNPKIISFDNKLSIFNYIKIDFLINVVNIENIQLLDNLILDKNKEFSSMVNNDSFFQSSGTDIHEINDFSKLFSNCPDNIFIKFVMFSPNSISKKCKLALSFDWISPHFNHDVFKSLDGFYLCKDEIKNIEIQIQTMIQRYTTDSFAVNLSTQSFITKQFDISPSVFTIPSARDGTTISLNVSYPRILTMSKECQIQIVSSYVVVLPNSEAIQRTQVTSVVFNTSKDILPILRSIDPSIIWTYLLPMKSSNTQIIKDFLRKLLDLYKTKVIDAMPASTKQFDPFFLLLPNLRWILKFFYSNIDQISSMHIIEKEMRFSKFCRNVSFWESQNEKIEESSLSYFDSDQLFNSPPIVVVDSCFAIDIYMDDQEIKEGSKLSQEIKKSIEKRFPIPLVQIFLRDSFYVKLPHECFHDFIKLKFGQPLSK